MSNPVSLVERIGVWAAELAAALGELGRAEAALENTILQGERARADAYLRVLAAAIESGEKLTEAGAEAMVICDPHVQAAENGLLANRQAAMVAKRAAETQAAIGKALGWLVDLLKIEQA